MPPEPLRLMSPGVERGAGPRVGYVLKVYPRFSETFILTEVLAHEAAGLELEIFSLRPALDGRFHEALAGVRAPVTYVEHGALKGVTLWREISEASLVLPGLLDALADARGEDAEDVHQAIVVARAARERGLTHLHAHFGTAATTVARLAARFAGLPYTFTAHAKDIFHEGVERADLARKLLDAAAVVTVSDYNRAVLEELCPGTTVRRIYNGLELAGFPYADPGERPGRVVAVGRLVEKKGFDDLVEACATLRLRRPDFACDIVGTGELEPELRAQIERLAVGDRVRLLGPRSQEEVKRLIAGAAVMAVPCVVGADGNRDGLPTVLLEAMALGTPCVATDVTGIPEILGDGETGLETPQRDPAALAARLDLLLGDGRLRSRLAAAARRQVEARFDVHRNAAALRELFHRPCAPEAYTAEEAARTGAGPGPNRHLPPVPRHARRLPVH